MIWIITSPECVHEEEKIVQDLLQAGAYRVLLRKPGWSAAQYAAMLDKLNTAYYNRIIIRDNPLMASQYGLAGVHWSKTALAMLDQEKQPPPAAQHQENSTGIHSTAEIITADSCFTTLLLSPVFDSISKPGYKGKFASVAQNKGSRQVLALGGVDYHQIRLVKQWQFDGAALLGAIWKTPGKAVKNFCRIQELWKRVDLT